MSNASKFFENKDFVLNANELLDKMKKNFQS